MKAKSGASFPGRNANRSLHSFCCSSDLRLRFPRSRSIPGCPMRTLRHRRRSPMILAGVLLKMGGYGIIRIAFPLCPFGAQVAAWTLVGVGGLQHYLRRAGGDGADRLQAASRVQFGQPYGLRHDRHRRLEDSTKPAEPSVPTTGRWASTARCSRCSATASPRPACSSWSA